MIVIQRYTPAEQPAWDAFVTESKNGTFLFLRGYMDYHADRFCDHSLMCYNDKQKLVALLPANEVAQGDSRTLYSHQGLTYGGFILSARSTMSEVLDLFESVRQYLAGRGFSAWYYKPMPSIYHRLPAEEDLYALFRMGAQWEVCNISCAVPLQTTSVVRPRADRRRRRGLQKALMARYQLVPQGNLEVFWPIVEQNLAQKYNARPVHTLQEMQRLQQQFPLQIQCFLAMRPADADSSEPICEGGVVLYDTGQVVHAQYPHATERGKADGVMDFLYLSLMEQYRATGKCLYFDFGTSNEEGGRYLNASLIAQKEGFGGRGIAYSTYKIEISLTKD